MISFTKMQGTGNDYVCIDTRKKTLQNIGRLSRAMCDRHFGIGSDGLILILPSKKADLRMRMFNPDGSEAEMCGNGIRCFARYVYDHKILRGREMKIETAAGIKHLTLTIKSEKVHSIRVNMGSPVLERERIPMKGDAGTVVGETLVLPDNTRFEITSVSMGNPHVIIFVEDIERFPVEKYGPLIENHYLFPQRTNVEFVKILGPGKIAQRTWERGAGETLSCGTGASAVTAACILNKLTERKITIQLRGGNLVTEWREDDNSIYLDGPAVEVFKGEWKDL